MRGAIYQGIIEELLFGLLGGVVIGLVLFLCITSKPDSHNMPQSQSIHKPQQQEKLKQYEKREQYYYPGAVPGHGQVLLVPK